MILYLFLFSLVEKIVLYDGLECLKCVFISFQFDVLISDMDNGAMVDDNTVLISESGKEIILTSIFWHQWPWVPPKWSVIVTMMNTSSDNFESAWSFRCFKQISLDLLWKQCPPKKPPWIHHDQDAKGRRLLSPDELFNIYILIQYIWYQNIQMKSWITSKKKWQYKVEGLVSLLYGEICTIVEN